MTRVQLHRPARIAPPQVAAGDVTVPAPPRREADQSTSPWLRLAMPLLGAGGGLAYLLMRPGVTALIVAGLALVGSVAMALVTTLQQRGGANRRRRRDRERYLDHLDVLRDRLEATARAQDDAGRWRHPPIGDLLALALDRRRVWERRPQDADFGQVRVGTGSVPLASAVRREDGNDVLAEFDPVCEEAARELLDDARELPGQPLTVELAKNPVLSVIGSRETRRSLTRGIVAQLTTFHAPEDWHLALCVSREAAPHWDWAKWLPNLELAQESGQVARLVAADPAALAALLHDELERRSQPVGPMPDPAASAARRSRVLVVVDGYLPAEVFDRAAALRGLIAQEDLLGFGMVFLVDSRSTEPSRVDARIEVEPDGKLRLESPAGPDSVERTGLPDLVPEETAEAVARALAPLRDGPEVEHLNATVPIDLPGLLGIGVPDGVGPGSSWREGLDGSFLNVPIGVRDDGAALHLDLKEAALGGMGPHGLVVGATGSGKSELLRTLVTALAATHPPEFVSLVLVDFKGGATFAGLADLPHVAGLITNLQGDLALVDRVYQALFGELNRRQELLRAAGNLASVHEYQERRQAGARLDPLPNLLVIVDEFGELLTSRPEFIDLFVAIGRLGRSLGMHLLLATQRLEEGRLRGLESHLSYRICLRTFSALESRAVIDVPDAYYLPPLPGSAYLKVDTTVMERFRSALVSTAPDERAFGTRIPPVMAFDLAGERPLAGSKPAEGQAPKQSGPPPATTMTLIVERLRAAAPRAHQIWLPPLPARIALGNVLPAPGRAGGWRGSLRVPVGIADRPQEQRQEVLSFDFSGGLGHLVVVGAPRTGKSGLLRTLVTSLALTHTPHEVQIYGIDYGGGGLNRLDLAPHVGTIARRSDAERVRRVVNEVWSLMAAREEAFQHAGLESMDDYRRHRGKGPDDAFGDVFLLIDDWPAFRLEHQDLEAAVIDVAGRGLGYGIHLVISAQRWIDVRSSLRESLGTRLELRLNDHLESEIDRRASANLTAAPPGRGITRSGVKFQVLLPEGGPVGWRLDDVLRELAESWTGPKAPPVRVLPTSLDLDDLVTEADAGRGVPIGLAEDDLAPVYLDLSEADPHFLILGDGESGKSNFLRMWLAGLCQRTPPAGSQVLVVDYRRSLLDAVPTDHLLSYAGTPAAAGEAIGALREVLVERLPPATVNVRQLRERSWWSGPDIYVVVDDYDLAASPAGNPLHPLLDLLAQGRDLGLHLVLARRAAGAGRAFFEPLLGRLKELGTPGLLLSGDPEEGPLLGACRPGPMPAGRGVLVRRRATPVTIQTALLPLPDLEEVSSA